jgi:predicted SPOUT superfamily RNA methylase MTH1
VGKTKRHTIGIAVPETLGTNLPRGIRRNLTFGRVARSCSIFGVSDIWVYWEDLQNPRRSNAGQLVKVLRYLETPQYLRKRLFPKDPDLRYVGALPPLRTPHHRLWIPLSDVKPGTLREGVVVSGQGDFSEVDVGLDSPVVIKERLEEGQRITVEITTVEDKEIFGRVIRREDIGEYWGYEVHSPESGLDSLLQRSTDEVIILTSRHGEEIQEVWTQLLGDVRRMSILIVFGGPTHGIGDILGCDRRETRKKHQYTVNMVPSQLTETVRTEEAIEISLSVLNFLRYLP